MTCENCKTPLSCGCQKKVASDGKSVCSSCVVAYEDKLKEQIDTLKKFTSS